MPRESLGKSFGLSIGVLVNRGNSCLGRPHSSRSAIHLPLPQVAPSPIQRGLKCLLFIWPKGRECFSWKRKERTARAERSAPGKQIQICQCKVWVAHGTWWPLREDTGTGGGFWKSRESHAGSLGSLSGHTQPGWGQKGHLGLPWLHPLVPFPLALPWLGTDSGGAVSQIRQDTAELHGRKATGKRLWGMIDRSCLGGRS